MQTDKIIKILSQLYPNPKTPLIHKNLYELFVAVLLSPQMTDARLNTITPQLFKKYPGISKLATANIHDLESIIRQINYYRTKAKHLVEATKIIKQKYNSQIPDTMTKLIALPGIGRKCANVLMSEGFHNPQGIVVDTHVIRLSNRLGLTTLKDPYKIEQDLKKIIPQRYWREFSLWLIYHGRQVCTARNPKCDICKLQKLCLYRNSI